MRSFHLLHNWKAKLGSLVLATLLWLVIHRSASRGPVFPAPTPIPGSESVPRE